MEKILELLEHDGSLTPEQLGVMVEKTTDEVSAAIEEYKKNKVIVGSRTIIDWEKTEREMVTAIIELRATPQSADGFDKIAEHICQFPEVKSLYLTAGGYDLMVVIEGKSLEEISSFVTLRLATMDAIKGTYTRFILKKYKSDNVIFGEQYKDTREVMCHE